MDTKLDNGFDVELSSGLDMMLPYSTTQNQIFSKVDNAIQVAKEFQNMRPVWDVAIKMSQFTRATGLGLAKLFYEGLQVWNDLGLGSEDAYYDEAYINSGKHVQTVKRYTSIWAMFADEHVPGDYKEGIMALGVKALAPIAQLIKEGHDVPSEKWLAFSQAADEAEVRKIKKEITGKKNNPNSLSIFIDKDGDITAITGTGRTVFIGYLRSKDTNPDVQKAVNRIINASGIIEK